MAKVTAFRGQKICNILLHLVTTRMIKTQLKSFLTKLDEESLRQHSIHCEWVEWLCLFLLRMPGEEFDSKQGINVITVSTG